MHIDRKTALDSFASYVGAYDPENPKVALKIEHTYRVAELCDRIARSEGWAEEDVDLAWVCGLVHDIGRFEQVRRYGTFADALSASHADIGVEVLFGDDMHIRDYLDDDAADELVRSAVAYHSGFRLPEGLDGRTEAFCNLLRDADKVDILRAFCESDPEIVLNLEPGSLAASKLGPKVLEAFWSHRTCRRDERVHPADFIASYACFVFELVYPESRTVVREQGHIFDLLSRGFSDPSTEREFARMRNHVAEWLEQ